MLTCNLFQHTCFSCLKSTFFILSYQLHCCWLDDPHRFPGPTHSTGGRGVDVMTMTMAGGVGGGPGTWNIYIYIGICLNPAKTKWVFRSIHFVFRGSHNARPTMILERKASPSRCFTGNTPLVKLPKPQ